MQKIALQLSERQAAQLLNQLSPSLRIHLLRLWEHETWPTRFRRLMAQIQRRVQQHPRLAQQAMKAIEPARQAFHASRRPRH